MTKLNPNAPRQVALIAKLTDRVDAIQYVFITDDEIHTGAKVLEGEWLVRLDRFLLDPESGIGSDEYERKVTKALITKRYRKYLDRSVVDKLTNCLVPPKRALPSKEERLAKAKKLLGKM